MFIFPGFELMDSDWLNLKEKVQNETCLSAVQGRLDSIEQESLI